MRAARLLPAIAVVAALFATPVFAQTTSTNNCHPITNAERAQLKEAGVDEPSTGMFCDKDKQLLNGSCPETPYPYLESKKTNGGVDVAHLNADFACRLYKFLKASDAAGMNIKITSGYRSIAKQQVLYASYKANGGAPVAPPGRSRHNYGIAVDLTFDGVWPNYSGGSAQNTPLCLQRLKSCKWAHDNSGSFGLRWPMVVEPWHVEPGSAVQGGANMTNDSGYWATDGGTSYSGGALSSVSNAPYYCLVSLAPIVTIPTQYPPGPGSGCYNAQTSSQLPYSSSPLLSTPSTLPMTNPSTVPPTATNPTAPGATTPAQNMCVPGFSCTNNVQYYRTSSCTSQVYQVCTYGCNGNVCAAASSTDSINGAFSTSSTGTNPNATTNTNSNTNANANVSDILNSIANNFSATPIATSSTVGFTLNPDTSNVAQISTVADGQVSTGDQVPTESTASANATSSGIGVISSVQPTVGGQQTFTSGDLGAGSTFNGTRNTSALAAILANMRAALEWAINILKPFGGARRSS